MTRPVGPPARPGPAPSALAPTTVLPLRSWLAISHLTVLLLPLLVLVASGTLAKELRDQTRSDLEHQASLIAMLVESEVRQARWASPGVGIACCSRRLSSYLSRAKAETYSGFQITDRRGIVVANSGSKLGEDLSGNAEVAEALSGQSSLVIRPRPLPSRFQPLSSESRRAKIRLFVAIPVEIEGEILGSIVVSRTPREEVQALYQMAPTAALSALGALLFTLALAWGAGVLAARSLRGLDQGAQRIADGDFGGIDDLARPRHSHIAEVAGVARSFTRMASRLQERMGYIGEFASNVSHEFKTPLATLRGTVELLSDDEEMPGVQRERFLDNAERELDRLERMVTGLLSLARADESHSRSPVVLDEVLASVARDAGIELQGRAHPVLGDRDQLEAVASNLVQNALRHGGDGVCVQIRAWSGEGESGFEV
ncbi:MAG TPA: HAMP domain-containing protein, partial [Deltaproteobacteria bacterium]|nr:HAMP domain-containing protein [Deltaproteobacteria bacterium]